MNKKIYYLKYNDCYKSARSIGTKKGIIVHSTGANNKTLKRYIQPNDGQLGENKYNNDWNRSGLSKCVHAMIGEVANGDIWVYETLPYTYACWGCGSGKNGSYNYSPNGHIQFEILEGSSSDIEYFNKVWKTAVEYCVWLCKTYGFNEINIISHKEAYNKGYATDHSDADSYFKRFGKTMNDFRNDVRKGLATGANSNNTTSNTTNPTVKTVSFATVNTSSSNLNCRETASSSGNIIGSFKKGKELLLMQKTNKDWYKVKGLDIDGRLITGYCSIKYLITVSSNSVVTVNTSRSNLNCRKTASSSGTVIGQFTKGQNLVLVNKTNNSWYKVKGMDVKGNIITGYCSATYLK